MLRARLPLRYPAWVDADGFEQMPVAQAVHIGDVTGDGLDDLVAVVAPFDMAGGSRLLRYARDAAGTLGAPAEFVLHGSGPVSAHAWSDLDRNGRHDLILARLDWNTGQASLQVVHFGGGLRIEEFDVGSTHGALRELVVADVDRDGDGDLLALAHRQSSATQPSRLALLLLRNTPGGVAYERATPVAEWWGGALPPWTGIAAGDFNGDAHIDVAVHWAAETTTLLPDPSSPDEGGLHTLHGDGTGGFSPARRLATPREGVLAASIVAGDFDGDRRDDLAGLAAQDGFYRLAVFAQGAAGLAGTPRILASTTALAASQVRGHALLAADLDSDYRVDLVARYVAGDYLIGLHRRVGGASDYADAFQGAAPAAAPTAAGHLDGDACPELVVATAVGLDILGSTACPGERAPPMAAPLPPLSG